MKDDALTPEEMLAIGVLHGYDERHRKLKLISLSDEHWDAYVRWYNGWRSVCLLHFWGKRRHAAPSSVPGL
jgi:hypothetical protein